ncbi:glycosyltransferase family 4 protein [Parasphingorhabdus sp.]|uniref:glycosyltransferase family 4 protein n=1 Tax=Parasphingorhabdus sp. TaxID=2709688 RepID=UPI003A909E02
MTQPRIAIVVSHPIQHFCPQYASLAAISDWQVKVFFASSMGKKAYHDKDFGHSLAWSSLSLDAFEHQFLSEDALPSSKNLDAPELDQALAAYDPDVVVIYGYWQKVQRRALAWAVSAGKRIYYISDSELAHGAGGPKSWLKTLLLRRRLAPVSRFLTVGTWNEDFYRRVGAPVSKMTRMNFPIDIAAFDHALADSKELREKTRRELGFKPDDFVIATVGKLVPRKRQADLIRAVLIAKPEARLRALVIGSGPDEAALQTLVNGDERVRMCGFISPEALPALYLASDAYTHLSSYEPHSLAISEAIYCGLPVVLSDRCGSYGPSDDVEPGANGFVFPVGDVESLAGMLSRLAQSPSLRQRFSKRSLAYALDAQHQAHGEFLRIALTADGLWNT